MATHRVGHNLGAGVIDKAIVIIRGAAGFIIIALFALAFVIGYECGNDNYEQTHPTAIDTVWLNQYHDTLYYFRIINANDSIITEEVGGPWHEGPFPTPCHRNDIQPYMLEHNVVNDTTEVFLRYRRKWRK